MSADPNLPNEIEARLAASREAAAGGSPATKIDVGRQLFKNSFLIVVARFVTAFASLLCVPFIIARLEVSGYGTWELLTAFAAFIMILQTPISGTLLWRMSAAYGANDPAEARRLLRLGVGMTLSIFLVFTPVVWLTRYSVVQLFNVPADLQDAAAGILVFVVGITILGGINEALAALISGYQRTGFVVLIQAAAATANYLISIAALLLGYGLWSLWMGFACAFGITLTSLYLLGTRYCNAISLWPALPARSDVTALGRYAGLLLVGSCSTGLRIHVDKMILATFASPVWTGYYGIAFRLANLVMEASNFFYTPTLAAAGALYSSADWNGLKRLYSRMMSVVAFVAGAVTVIVLGLYDRLLVMWLGEVMPEVPLILAMLITANTVAVVLTGPGTALAKGIGRVGIETAYVTLNLILKLLLMVALIWWMGALGTVVASVISWSVSAAFFAFLLHRYIDLPVAATRRAAYSLVAVAATVVVVRLGVANLELNDSRIGAGLSVVVLSFPAMVVYIAALVAVRAVRLPSLRDFAIRLHTLISVKPS